MNTVKGEKKRVHRISILGFYLSRHKSDPGSKMIQVKSVQKHNSTKLGLDD